MQTTTVPFQVQISWLEDQSIITVNLDSAAAKRKVSGWASGEVATSCGSGHPVLMIEQARVYWRVPVIFTHHLVGHVGQIGVVDVDAQTGAMNTTQQLAEAMLKNATTLAEGFPTQTVPA
jgi:hypothetical protein